LDGPSEEVAPQIGKGVHHLARMCDEVVAPYRSLVELPAGIGRPIQRGTHLGQHAVYLP
jgi:hypothetical protein